MPAEKSDILQGIKSKEVKRVGYVLNNAMEDGYIGLIGNQKTLAILGYDDSEMFRVTPQKPGLIEKITGKK